MSDAAEIAFAAERLRAGGLVAFPTETVYGLGADASNPQAVALLYAAKGRPERHPVIVHFADASDAFGWAREVPAAARRLADAFWPGPLTLVLSRSSRAGDFVTGGQDSVGLRVPSHPVARALLAAFRGEERGRRYEGIAAPSANRYGRISPTTAAHVREEFGAELPIVLEGGASEIGIESSIVDCSRGQPVLLRPGHIGAAQLEAALGGPLAARDAAAPRHSGGEARHYAPRTPVRLVATDSFDAEAARPGARFAALVLSAAAGAAVLRIGMPSTPAAYAQRLYAALREADAARCDAILVEAPSSDPAWAAVRDRLQRAASPVTIAKSVNSPFESESP